MKKIIIPKPLLVEQREISNRLRSIRMRIEKESQTKVKLEKQKKGLMHDLLTGKVQVKVDQEETAVV